MKKIAANIVFGMVYLWSLWPLKIHYLFADILYFILYRIFKYRLTVVLTNISRSFPELKYSEVADIAKDFYHNLADVMVEGIWSVSASEKSIRNHTGFEGTEDLEKAYQSDRCTITLLAHFHNWEIWGGIPDLKKYYGINIPNSHFNFIYKRPENAIANDVMLRMRTCHHSVNFVETNTIARHILSDKTRKNIYFFACDQYPSANTHIDLTFLNQPTGMISGPGEIARKLKLGVGYWSVRREGRGKYIARYVHICDDASLHETGFVTSEYARLLEADIRSDKSRWLWSHKRWK
ncbi:MAG: lysophospholipid acyltransferase family protein [Alistipes sp.]|nr:lysophospholipid acyltransferase family protein [Candidatus Minthomonas equi]